MVSRVGWGLCLVLTGCVGAPFTLDRVDEADTAEVGAPLSPAGDGDARPPSDGASEKGTDAGDDRADRIDAAARDSGSGEAAAVVDADTLDGGELAVDGGATADASDAGDPYLAAFVTQNCGGLSVVTLPPQSGGATLDFGTGGACVVYAGVVNNFGVKGRTVIAFGLNAAGANAVVEKSSDGTTVEGTVPLAPNPDGNVFFVVGVGMTSATFEVE
jgi:hypothetical protein